MRFYRFNTAWSVKADKLKTLNTIKQELDSLYDHLSDESDDFKPSDLEKISIQNQINVRLQIIDEIKRI